MQDDHSSAATAGLDADASPPQAESGFRQLIGYRLTRWSEGFAEVQLDVGPQHLNTKGTVHGGVLMAVLDGASGRAIAWCATPGHVRQGVTVSLSINFIKATRTGRLIATARVTGGKRIVSVVSEVRDEAGTLLAQGQGSFQYLRGHEHRDGVPLAQGASA